MLKNIDDDPPSSQALRRDKLVEGVWAKSRESSTDSGCGAGAAAFGPFAIKLDGITPGFPEGGSLGQQALPGREMWGGKGERGGDLFRLYSVAFAYFRLAANRRTKRNGSRWLASAAIKSATAGRMGFGLWVGKAIHMAAFKRRRKTA